VRKIDMALLTLGCLSECLCSRLPTRKKDHDVDPANPVQVISSSILIRST
jgi:hypothetical protein